MRPINMLCSRFLTGIIYAIEKQVAFTGVVMKNHWFLVWTKTRREKRSLRWLLN